MPTAAIHNIQRAQVPATVPSSAQSPVSPVPIHPIEDELSRSLIGDWVGVLEYRDYSEPVTSTKRVLLPTWLSISANGSRMLWQYTYDDGPGKTVKERDVVELDVKSAAWTEAEDGKTAQTSKVTGLEGLKEGRGQLLLLGNGVDADKPCETRVTMTIKRSLLDLVEETRPLGSTVDFAFRHSLRFTRASPPAPTP